MLLLLGLCQAKRYIVLFKHDISQASIQSHADWLETAEVRGDTIKGFGVGGVRGYSADMPESVANEIRKREDVLSIEENAEYRIQIDRDQEYAGASYPHFLREEYDIEYFAPLNSTANESQQSIEKSEKKVKKISTQHNIIKGRRPFRKNPVKKIYRPHRNKPHPLFGFSKEDGNSGRKIALPPKENIQPISQRTMFKKLHYPFTSKNLAARGSVPWGLSRMSQGKTVYALDTFVYPKSAGKGVYVYVLDTGIEAEHSELKGKVERGINIVEGNLEPRDDHGHGTHCAGIIAGNTVGVAKNATLIPVKILTSEGKGSTEFAVLGLIYAMKSYHQRIKTEKHPRAVVNMSLGGIKSEILKEIAKRAIATGLTIVAAGGNDASNACGYSPASIHQVITVGAVNREDDIAEFSNTGECIDVYAPGVEIVSSFLNNTMKALSGTSMAAPHVSGLAALYLGEQYMEPHKLKMLIKSDAHTSDMIRIATAKILNLRLE
ncbi:cerevisin [Nematocida minor]|uniref:cerevisin n=1 Tax=Nematocida minor TaxID=1912983 RepID=UPI002220CA24|nr:cerevisin [Nematocida minor]KAI5189164.1 cerevisin [Nematocida minor]